MADQEIVNFRIAVQEIAQFARKHQMQHRRYADEQESHNYNRGYNVGKEEAFDVVARMLEGLLEGI